MVAARQSVRTNFVSFSGIDGAGKSTQIDALCARLRQEGLRVETVKFWDDIARLKGIRETTGHKVFKGDKGVGSPEAPIVRRDKNVQSWTMTSVRFFIARRSSSSDGGLRPRAPAIRLARIARATGAGKVATPWNARTG